jgi:N-acetyl-D-muramate 6-phosphate phosphatase
MIAKAARSPLRGVLFDLDGTLLDTAPDLVEACNRAVRDAGLQPQPADVLKPLISEGAPGMLQYTLARNRLTPAFEPLLAAMLDRYETHLAVHTRLFDGMAEVLEEIEHRAIPWGIVTNKIGRFTEPLLRALNLRERAACVVSGDSLPEKKPHPLPMLDACRQIGVSPADCVFVGDARRDVEAGRNAGIPTLAALYGYVPENDPAEDWGADGLLQSPRDLLLWMEGAE